jgi:integrase
MIVDKYCRNSEDFRMKKPILKVRPYRHSKGHKFILDLRGFRKGRMFFKTRSEADAELARQRSLLERHSRAAIGLSQREMSEIISAKQELAPFGKTIPDAVHFFVDRLERVRRCKTTIAQLADEVLKAKQRDGMSKDYLRDLSSRFSRFCGDFGNRLVATLSVEEIDNWLRDLELSPQSRVNYRSVIGVLFSHALKRGMIDSNPIMRTAKPKVPGNPPEIFTVDALRSLLNAANDIAPDVLPMLAIGAFAGLREAEIQRLDWSEVELVRGHIDVKAAKAKSAKRRIVPIQPNLAAWLATYVGMNGRVVPKGARRKLDHVRKAANLSRWPKNGLRHSFGSYRLAAIHDAPRVAAELGHTSPQMLYSTYRELVMPEEAARYWNVLPDVNVENVVSFSA